ncbi:hypothetical protein J2S00_003638 [Caldalkalibacillus uzonensis]|uniref:Uncharacterized protein n=1 Tax=Caldalkalibacillus uzonensis TaxID=353224 RepID=A0ABU0CWJ7_9BACI|nr:hypothetical protein [Caldalkalibacillus uzonensis]MDQ0340798.1 hypothetical protein [Caldalkalibacillus uzonensis]
MTRHSICNEGQKQVVGTELHDEDNVTFVFIGTQPHVGSDFKIHTPL